LVQGDTTSAFSVALASFHRKIKVIHLEAGLRTYDKAQPYPEEFNRQAISRIADIHLCPTNTSKQYLVNERTQGKIEVVGNTVLDNLVNVEVEYSNRIIVTMHRRENHHNMAEWFSEISKIAKSNSNLEFIIPLHPNPNVQKHKNLLEGVKVIGPMEYDEFISLLAKSKFVITDSGGLQEETSFLGKKCIVCREKTERTEGLGSFAHICQKPSDLSVLFQQINDDYKISGPSPYGDGNSSEKILEILRNEI
jgi:UDP-N-acetylglucosamine 2-epimerase